MQEASFLVHPQYPHSIHSEPKRFVELSNDIQYYNATYLNTLNLPQQGNKMIEIHPGLVPLYFHNNLHQTGNRYYVDASSETGQYVLNHSEDRELRRRIFLAQNELNVDTVDALENLLLARDELSRVVTNDRATSFADFHLSDKLAGNPRMSNMLKRLNDVVVSVNQFLRKSALKIKSRLNGRISMSRVMPWDVTYEMNRHLASKYAAIPGNISLNSIIQSFARVSSTLFGITMEPVTMSRESVWRDSVRKLAVYHDIPPKRMLGYIYLDIMQEEGKYINGATHYTIRCSRRIFSEELAEMDNVDSEHYGKRGDEEIWQVPKIVVSMSISPNHISLHDIETFFHEMGHALHGKNFASYLRERECVYSDAWSD